MFRFQELRSTCHFISVLKVIFMKRLFRKDRLYLFCHPYLISSSDLKPNTLKNFDYILRNSVKIVQWDNIEPYGPLCTYTLESPT